ncbi:MAG: DNA-binding protein [Candidatus Odinarchaeia archaeon]
MDELERIKLEKMKKMLMEMERKKQELEKREKIEKTKEYILKSICTPDAYEYITILKAKKTNVAKILINILLRLAIERAITRKLTKIDIMALERRIEGRGPEIKIKRRGEDVENFSEMLKKS